MRPSSRLFTVRIWVEQVGEGVEYRGAVCDVLSGAWSSFRQWADLGAFMRGRLEAAEVSDQGEQP